MYSRFPVQCAEAMCLLLSMHTVLLVPQWIVHPDLKSTYCFYAYMHEIMNLNHSKSACTKPGVARAIARTAWSIFGWSQDRPEALPPFASNGELAPSDDGLSDDASQRPPVINQDDLSQSNGGEIT
eukprot:COSAG05_NODE_50_length_24118_cov_89.534036_18_plen_126_part_00